MDAQRALLDSLLGTDRNAKEGAKKQSFKDEDVCKHYLVGDCPHDMFVNQDGNVAVNSPIGACRRQHSEAMRMRFKEHEDYRKYQWRYLQDLRAQLQRLVDDNDKKAKAVQQKLNAGTSAGFETVEAVVSHMQARDMLVSEKLEAAEKMAEEGDMETSQGAMKAAQELTHQRYRLARLKEVAEAWVDEVCWTCGYQVSWRSVEELEARDKGRPHPHTMGSWHSGWARVRQALSKVNADVKACREAGHAGGDDWYKDGDEKGRDRDRDRGKEKDKDRDRDGGKDNERSKDTHTDRDRDKQRDKDRSVEKAKDKDRSKGKDKSRDRDRDKERARSKSAKRDRDRSKVKERSRSRDRSRSRSRKAARKRSASKDQSRRRSASRKRDDKNRHKRDRKRSVSTSSRRSPSRKKETDKKSKDKKSKDRKVSSSSASRSRSRSPSRKKQKDKKSISKAKRSKEKKSSSSSNNSSKSSSRSRGKSATKAKEKEKSKAKDKKEKEKEKKKKKSKKAKKSSTSSSS